MYPWKEADRKKKNNLSCPLSKGTGWLLSDGASAGIARCSNPDIPDCQMEGVLHSLPIHNSLIPAHFYLLRDCCKPTSLKEPNWFLVFYLKNYNLPSY